MLYNLYSRQGINMITRDFNFRWRKKWGQHFLVDKTYVDRIVEAAGLTREDTVLEIGPGLGALTVALAETAGNVMAVEIDEKALPVLETTLEGKENVTVVLGDILKIDLPGLMEGKGPFKVAANLPYYITTPITMYLLEQKFDISLMVLMVQKEVAERMAAPPGGKDYGALSVAVQYYTIPELLFTIPPGAFYPAPEVSSAVVRLIRREEPVLPVAREDLLFRVVKAAFNQRRKTLSNALASLGYPREDLHAALADCAIDPQRRGETLSVEDFIRLSNRLAEVMGEVAGAVGKEREYPPPCGTEKP